MSDPPHPRTWTASDPIAGPRDAAAAVVAAWWAADPGTGTAGTTPVTATTVLGWWREPYVTPRLLLDPDGTPVAYGEVWDDEEEDEVELARLVVDPARRREGIGGRLVDVLLALAAQHDRAGCFLRVLPGNSAARALYASAGFVEVDQASADAWNAGQPAAYVWMRHAGPT